jgi:hypothetical protein
MPLVPGVFQRGSGSGNAPHRARPRLPDEQALLLWALTGWTVAQAFVALFARGAVGRALTGGLSDVSARHLLGIQFLLAATIYALLALGRLDRHSLLGWAPFVVQTGTAAVALLALLDGGRSFGGTGLLFFVALGFALLLAGFRLAGEPYVRSREPSALGNTAARAALEDARTERLDATRSPAPSPDAADDDVLGI